MQTNFYPIVDIINGKLDTGMTVTVKGWVRTRRDSKAGCSFIAISDGSCFQTLQIVAATTLSNYQQILSITTGCAIEITGELVSSPGQGQSLEVKAQSVNVIGWVTDPDTYPITPKYHTLEYLREYAHLRPRTNMFGAVTRVQHQLAAAIHRFFDEHGFYWIRTPIITTSDCEGAGQLFRVTALDLNNIPKVDKSLAVDFSKDFFAKEAFLTVSGQLNVEAYCAALSKVYTFGPTFRAENSNTSRHLAEFWQIEPEIAFANLNDIAQLAVAMLKYVASALLERCSEDMKFFAERVDKDCINRLEKLISSEFLFMDYTDAITALQGAGKKFDFPIAWGLDLQSEHERYLVEEIIHGPVVLQNYPKEIKSFYMRLNEDGKTVAAMDVLVPGIGEIIGGSQREERYDNLRQRMNELGMIEAIYSWYLDLRKYGTVPHAGFGLGFERLIMYVTGLTNIRDVIPFPRTPKHAEF